LRKGGLLHLAVPNILCWESAFPGWPGYEPYHFTYLSAKTLRMTLEQAGFSVMRLETHESFSGWFLTVLRSMFADQTSSAKSLEELRRKLRSRWMEHCYRTATVLVGAVTLPVRFFQSSIGRGDELAVLCRAAESSA